MRKRKFCQRGRVGLRQFAHTHTVAILRRQVRKNHVYAEIRHAFLPCVLSTSGRLHGEFLRLLYIIAHRRTTRWFQRHSNDEPSEDAFKFRRGQYFWHTRAAIGQAAARAVAQRVHVAEHTLRRHRVPSNVHDDLAYPATVH